MRGAVVIVIPRTPDKCLAPNAARRTHYMAKHDVSSDLRYLAKMRAREVEPTDQRPFFVGPVVVEERVYWGKGERRIDIDGVPHMCKALLDGVCDAGIILNDSQVMRLVVEQHRDAQGVGRVEIVITELVDWQDEQRVRAA